MSAVEQPPERARCTMARRGRGGARGAVYVEFLIAFLPLLIFFLCLWQISILYTTKLLVDHAAFSGARAAAVIIAENPNRVNDRGGPQSVNVLTGRRNRLVQDAVGLALMPLVLDSTVIFFNVQYPEPDKPGGPNVMLEQKYLGMTADSVSMARVRVRAMMNCKIAFANMIMCMAPWRKILGDVGVATQTFFPPYVYVVSEAVFPYQGASYAYDPNDDGGGSQNNANNTGAPLAAAQISGCFAAGTPIDTLGGPRPIEQVGPGTLVLTRDEASGDVFYEPVLGVSVRQDRALVDVHLIEAPTIRATPNHPFWTADRGWIPAGDLTVGEALFSPRLGELHVAGVEPEPGGETVYNFEVQDTHTYFVGDGSAWVHNQGQVCPAGDGGASVAPVTVAWINVSELPQEEQNRVNQTMTYIDSGTSPPASNPIGQKWGTTYKNYPVKGTTTAGLPPGQYQEYRVSPPPGQSGAGPDRIVVDKNTGAVYYTWTHYGDTGNPPFVRIR